MFCPNCGSENQTEVKFCRRCGTSLGAISLLMSGVVEDQSPQRVAELVKKYYAARHQIMLATLTIATGVALLAIIFGLGKWVFFWIFLWVFMALFGTGVRQFNKGWGDWSDASSELKALGYDKPPSPNMRLPDKMAAPPPQSPLSKVSPDSLAQVEQPRSVIESTTQLLDRKNE